MPGPTLNISTLNQESFRRQDPLLDSSYQYDNGPPTTFIFGPLFLSSSVYQLSPIEDWELATLLMRPLPSFSEEDMTRELVLTRENYGSVNRVFITSENDLVLKMDFQLWMIERNLPDHVEEIKGSDHMVMMSKPIDLWSHLLVFARRYT